jgi:hypothetical protein
MQKTEFEQLASSYTDISPHFLSQSQPNLVPYMNISENSIIDGKQNVNLNS